MSSDSTLPSNFLHLLGGVKLKKVALEAEDNGTSKIRQLLATEPIAGNDDSVRDYFFSAGIDEWYDSISHLTFPSKFVPLTETEARCIIDHWNKQCNNDLSNDTQCFDIPHLLESLKCRLQHCIDENFPKSSCDGVFVKLSSRSPKDSKTVFRKAVSAYNAKRVIDAATDN